jgi:hypothetical protein
MTARQVLRYLGPQSPWGPERGTVAFCATLLLIAVVMGPPMGFVCGYIFGWWWRLWL